MTWNPLNDRFAHHLVHYLESVILHISNVPCHKRPISFPHPSHVAYVTFHFTYSSHVRILPVYA